MPATTSNGKLKKTSKLVYKPVLKLPPLPEDQRQALRDNIAVNGVLVPILTDGGSPRRRIIDGNHRKEIADELEYDCPEITHEHLTEEELRTLARALNLARRQLTVEQKRALIADQLVDTPELSNRRIGRQLGVHHATVASVRAEMESSGQVIHCPRLVGSDGRLQASRKEYRPGQQEPTRSEAEIRARLKATTLIHGDCRRELAKIASHSVDCVVTDPIYPQVRREYGTISEAEWHTLMRAVVQECRRILKPKGSMVVIIHPNCERLGQMRHWPWEFVLWAAKFWNVVEDAYWHVPDCMPGVAGADRRYGLMRSSVKWCVWLGAPNCYRNQDAVLKPISDPILDRVRSDDRDKPVPSGYQRRSRTIDRTALTRGGSTPYNLLTVSVGGGNPGRNGHPAATPYGVADWWTRYLLPPGGILLDPFCGGGTMLEAGLNRGASKVIGIDKMGKYLRACRRRISR